MGKKFFVDKHAARYNGEGVKLTVVAGGQCRFSWPRMLTKKLTIHRLMMTNLH